MSTGALWTMAALALTTAACGSDGSPASSPATGSEWSPYRDQARGYEVGVPNGWQRASGSLTPNITSPREILTLATVRLDGVSPENYCRPRDEAQLPEFSERDALVTIQEGGRGSLRLNYKSYPPRPERFRPEQFKGGSTFTACFLGDLPATDHWFGFGDAGRAFHVLVIVGQSAPERVRREAWEILDSLRIDPSVEPDWQAGPEAPAGRSVSNGSRPVGEHGGRTGMADSRTTPAATPRPCSSQGGPHAQPSSTTSVIPSPAASSGE